MTIVVLWCCKWRGKHSNDIVAGVYPRAFFARNIPGGIVYRFVERVACLEPHEFMKDLHRKDWLVFSKDAKLSHSQLVADLHLLLQDKASAQAVLSACLLSPQWSRHYCRVEELSSSNHCWTLSSNTGTKGHFSMEVLLGQERQIVVTEHKCTHGLHVTSSKVCSDEHQRRGEGALLLPRPFFVASRFAQWLLFSPQKTQTSHKSSCPLSLSW